MEQEYMSVNSAASYMGMSRRAVYRFMEENALPYSIVRGRRRLRRTDIDAYMTRDRTLTNEELMKMADLKLLELEARRRRRYM